VPEPTKVELRAEFKRQRDALGEEERRNASLAICRRITAWPPFARSETVLSYLPMRAEVDLTPLLEMHPEKRWALPRILPKGQMAFHLYRPGELVRHPYGMLEPPADALPVSVDQVDLALVPGLAFDREGWRLGYGGGFFDRFLAGFDGQSAGVSYQALFVERLPHASHDIPVGYVVTELGLYTCRGNPA